MKKSVRVSEKLVSPVPQGFRPLPQGFGPPRGKIPSDLGLPD